jgi:type IV fimbrial biogenesis protein FimT
MEQCCPGTGLSRSVAAGFTLTELLIVLAVATVVLGIGLPGMVALSAGARATGAMLELRGLLDLARQYAVTNDATVTLCGTADGHSCSSVWRGNPTLVFVDSNANRKADAGEEIITTSTLTRNGSIRWRASGGRSYLRYHQDGGVLEYGSFQYCPGSGDARGARQIIVAATGRARAATDRDGDGIMEDRNGDPLDCS